MRFATTNSARTAWDVLLNDKLIDTVFFLNSMDEYEVRDSLIKHDGYDPNIEIYKQEVTKMNQPDKDKQFTKCGMMTCGVAAEYTIKSAGEDNGNWCAPHYRILRNATSHQNAYAELLRSAKQLVSALQKGDPQYSMNEDEGLALNALTDAIHKIEDCLWIS